MKIRILGVSGSPRHGNTEIMVNAALSAAKTVAIDHVEVETQIISLAGKNIMGCTNCRACIKLGHCILKDDWAETFKPLIDPIPDGVILGAPVYFFDINSQTRAFLERATSLLKANFFKEAKQVPPDWSHTVGASLAVGFDRNGGQEHTIAALNSWFICNDFPVVGAKHIGYIGAPGWLMGDSDKNSVSNDLKVGIKSAEMIGKRVTQLAYLIRKGIEANSTPL